MLNLKLALRSLLRSPFVTGVAVLSLGLGIGANAAIYSLFDQMLLKPLPVPQPERLVNLGAPGPKPGSQSCNQAGDCEAVFSYAMYRDLEEQQKVFTGLAAHRVFGANLAYENQTLTAEGALVSGSYFPTLGIQPALGRLLGSNDDRNIGDHYVAVLSHGYWANQLGSDPTVVGKKLIVNGQHMEVVGVAPEGFKGTTLGSTPYVFVPLTMRSQMSPGWTDFDNRRSYWAYVFGRLKPGVSIEQAETAINGIYRPIITDVELPLQEGISEDMLKRFRTREAVLAPGAKGQSSIHSEVRTPLLLLFAITGTVLLIACANIANLLLVRGAGRSHEMAIRLSIGASRRQVIRQLMTESLLLAALGGLASLFLARLTLAFIGSMLPPDATGSFVWELRPEVVVFSAILAIATGFLFGMFPALNSTRPDLVTSIRANAGNIAGVRAAARFRGALATAQIALAMALLTSAGLFIRSLINVSREDLGIETASVVTFGISPELNGYTPAQSRNLFARVEEEVGAIPGVTGVVGAVVPMLSNNNWGNNVSVEGFSRDPGVDTNARFNAVTPGYFETLDIGLLAGREFTQADALGAPRVAVVNEAFAKKFDLGKDVVGKRMAVGNSEDLDIEIVGLVRDAKYAAVRDEIPPQYFTPVLQDSTLGWLNFYARTSAPPRQLLRAIPPVLARLDPSLPVEELKTMPQQVRENIAQDRMISLLAAAFAVIATLLAGVGLYGVLSYTVAQRTREIGVRMAIGADASQVRAMVLRQVGRMLAIGGVIGIAAALALGKAAGSLLFGLKGNDPLVLVASAIVLGLVALSAGYLPARRASRVNPIQALRYD